MRFILLSAAILMASLAPAAAQQAKFDPKQCDGRTAKDCNDLMGSQNVPPDEREKVLLVRATALLQTHDLAGSIAEYREMTVVNPRSLLAFSTLGFLESIGENWKGAVPDLQRAVELAPDQDRVRGMLIVALAKSGDCNGANAALTEAKSKFQSAFDTAAKTISDSCH